MNTDFLSNFICNPESHTTDIIRQTIWILLNDAVYFLSVFFIDFHRKIQCNAILLQKYHCLTQISFFRDLV